MQEDFDAQVAGVAALAEPIRRALYRFVVAQPQPVDREQAAAGVGVAHHIAKFHLDKLVDDGLLDIEYSRPPGRGGPGAGRPAKRYRRADRDIAVSLPERRYDLAARVMAEAIETAQHTGTAVADALSAAARATGQALTAPAPSATGERPDVQTQLHAVGAVLAHNGYEPRITADRMTLSNCPFHYLAQTYTALTCGMNLDVVDGVLDALAADQTRAELAPAPGRCCVVVTNRAT